MVSAHEATQQAQQTNAQPELKAKLAAAKPHLEMFQYIAATQAAQTGFVVTLHDGTSYTAEKAAIFSQMAFPSCTMNTGFLSP